VDAGFSISDVLQLSVAERILLVEEIWDSIARCPEAVPLTDAQRRELDARFEDYRRNPHVGGTWEDVKDRVLQSA
jgi:putative addiction module component (TIGR02574 family)